MVDLVGVLALEVEEGAASVAVVLDVEGDAGLFQVVFELSGVSSGDFLHVDRLAGAVQGFAVHLAGGPDAP